MKTLFSGLFFCLLAFAASAQIANPNYDKAFISKAFQGHMDNIGRLADEGKLVMAGPMGKNDKTYRGIFIFDVKTLEEARKLVETDPAVKEKLLEAELYEYYGSAALPTHVEVHKKISKANP